MKVACLFLFVCLASPSWFVEVTAMNDNHNGNGNDILMDADQRHQRTDKRHVHGTGTVPVQSRYSSLSVHGVDRPFPRRLTGATGQHVNADSVASRIVGGEDADRTRYPYTVFLDLEYLGMEGVLFGCGGTLIHHDIVMSVAHCGEDLTYAFANVNFTQDFFRFGYSGNEHLSQVQDWVLHPDYNITDRSNDVMILKLETSAPFSYTPLRYNTDPTVPAEGEPVSVIGMGWTDFDSETEPMFLQEAEVDVVSLDQCNDMYRGTRNYTLSDVHLCAAKLPQGGVVRTRRGDQVESKRTLNVNLCC